MLLQSLLLALTVVIVVHSGGHAPAVRLADSAAGSGDLIFGQAKSIPSQPSLAVKLRATGRRLPTRITHPRLRYYRNKNQAQRLYDADQAEQFVYGEPDLGLASAPADMPPKCTNLLADHFNNSQFVERCQIPFQYKGVVYSECTDVDHTGPWCYHARQSMLERGSSDEPSAKSRWGACICAPEPDRVTTEQCADGERLKADTANDNHFKRNCVFPFTYKGVRFDACTDSEWTNPWCSLKTEGGRHAMGSWGVCACV